jgi:hypothetical protein
MLLIRKYAVEKEKTGGGAGIPNLKTKQIVQNYAGSSRPIAFSSTTFPSYGLWDLRLVGILLHPY